MGQRARKRRQDLHEASRTRVPSLVDVCVLGGGPGGLAAAIASARAGASIVVLERDAECGRRILATGNGRCNFANADLDPSLYRNAGFVASVVGPTWVEDVLSFLGSCGLAWAAEDQGRLYPLSRQAASVRNVLLSEAAHIGVTLACAREAKDLRRLDDGLVVRWQEAFGARRMTELEARCVVIATGGGSALVERLGIPIVPFEPTLCPLACEGPFLAELDGRRVRAQARLVRAGQELVRERGEVLFRTTGLSGIVTFNLSRHARPGDAIELDLLCDLTEERACVLARRSLDGLLDPVIARALLAREGDPARAIRLAKALAYRVTGVADASRAQVTRGGLDVDAFAPATLASHADDRLYACGEALDVDGPCGGFNLGWAWQSGMVAGRSAAERSTR